MKDNRMGVILMAFITILVGIVLLDSLADNIYLATTLSSAGNETMTISNTVNTVINGSITMSSQTGNTGNGSVTAVTFFGNGSNSTHYLGINVSEHVNWSNDGVITVSGTMLPADGVYNISYTYSTAGTGSTAEDDLTSVSSFGNATIGTGITGIEIDDEVNWTKAGVITVSTLNFSVGSYNISYGYEGDEYLTNTTAQTLIILIRIFFALAIVIVGYLLVKKGFEDIL